MRAYSRPKVEFAGGRQERSRKGWCDVAVHVNLDDLPPTRGFPRSER